MGYVLGLEIKQGLGNLPSDPSGQGMREGCNVLVIIITVVVIAVAAAARVRLSSTAIIGQHHLLLLEEGKQIPAVGILQYQVEAGAVVEVSFAAQYVGTVQPSLDLDLPPSDGDALLRL